MRSFIRRFCSARQQPEVRRDIQLTQHIVALEHETSETMRALTVWAQHLERIQPQVARM